MERLYHIVAISEKTGAETLMTSYAMNHKDATENLSRFSKHSGRRVQLKEVSAKDLPARERECLGFRWVYDENGAHFFQRKEPNGLYSLMRCLPEDLHNGNFEFLAKHGMTNTNKAPRKKAA